RQPALQRHLAALEAHLVEAAGARVLALVAAPAGLAEAGTDTAAHALLARAAARCRLEIIQTHRVFSVCLYCRCGGARPTATPLPPAPGTRPRGSFLGSRVCPRV